MRPVSKTDFWLSWKDGHYSEQHHFTKSRRKNKFYHWNSCDNTKHNNTIYPYIWTSHDLGGCGGRFVWPRELFRKLWHIHAQSKQFHRTEQRRHAFEDKYLYKHELERECGAGNSAIAVYPAKSSANWPSLDQLPNVYIDIPLIGYFMSLTRQSMKEEKTGKKLIENNGIFRCPFSVSFMSVFCGTNPFLFTTIHSFLG